MSSTLTYNISYPDGSQQPNVPLSMQTTAESVETALAGLPQGLQVVAQRTANISGTTNTWVAIYIPSFTFKANRNYQIIWTGAAYSSTAQQGALAQIQSCSTADAAAANTGLTELMGYNLVDVIANQNYKFNVTRGLSFTADTSLQIKGTLTTTENLAAGPTYPSQLSIIDLGSIPVPVYLS